MQSFDFPDRALFDVFVFIDASTPGRRFLIFPKFSEEAPATLGGVAVGSHINDGLQLNMVEQLASRQTVRRKPDKIFEHSRLADEYALSADFERAVISEEIGRLFPELLVDVETIDPVAGSRSRSRLRAVVFYR